MKRKLLMSVVAVLLCGYLSAQYSKITVSGVVKDSAGRKPLPFVSVVLHKAKDSVFVLGAMSREDGRFVLENIMPGDYRIGFSYAGYKAKERPLLVGQLSSVMELGDMLLAGDSQQLQAVTVTGSRDRSVVTTDKKTFLLSENISQQGGSVLETMKNLPGVTLQDGKLQLRGSDKIMVLIDGRQTALSGFGGQSGLENIPASAIEKIEIINNPSAKYDANGNAGIINIIFKKEKQEGFNGKVGFSTGLGALWVKRENLPSIRPQYQATPKINPSVSFNYRKNKVNVFFQGDNAYTKTLNKNEFVERFYDNGDTVIQQTKRNRTTNVVTLKSGADWMANDKNTFGFSALFSSEKILDRGDEPFFNKSLTQRQRLWQFLEDELKTTATATGSWQHKFEQPGRLLNAALSYTFHREDEKYFFTNILPSYTGLDSFKLLSDEHVADFTMDYIHPLRQGRFEMGVKFRNRSIPVNMQFKPGLNSPLDTTAGGKAGYNEVIPAVYGTYVFENRNFEVEAGLRAEYVNVKYDVPVGHPVYTSDSYHYLQPFPNVRLAYKLNERNKLTLFYNRRVDRPNEVDIRIFPKYDDAEIIKVGNPALRPQFTHSLELGFRTSWAGGYLVPAVYHKRMEGTITRIGTIVPGSTLIYNVFQNAGKSYATGIDLSASQKATSWATLNLNMNVYKNIIDAFTVVNKYPTENSYTAAREELISGNVKLNVLAKLPGSTEVQLAAIYQAPDLVPQGKVFSRFSIDAGVKKQLQKGRAEIFLNATDIANTLRIKREVQGNGFRYNSIDYYETQVIRLGYNYKF